jgi:single-strand DNA-binding protein
MVNKVTLMGHLGKDPIVRRTESGVPVATFSIATNERYKDKEGNVQDKTEWHNIVIWRGLAEVAEKYLKKGSLVYLEGKLQTRSYQAQDGTTRYATEVVVDEMKMLNRPEGGGGNHVPPPTEPPMAKDKSYGNTTGNTPMNDAPPYVEDDDLPF